MHCLKEVILADKLTKDGQSPQEIREAILRHEYAAVVVGN